MAASLPLENENNRIVNAILEMIRMQDLNVKQKIQQILKQEIEEEERSVSDKKNVNATPYTLEELYGILKDDGQPYETKRDEYLKEKYGL